MNDKVLTLCEGKAPKNKKTLGRKRKEVCTTPSTNQSKRSDKISSANNNNNNKNITNNKTSTNNNNNNNSSSYNSHSRTAPATAAAPTLSDDEDKSFNESSVPHDLDLSSQDPDSSYLNVSIS